MGENKSKIAISKSNIKKSGVFPLVFPERLIVVRHLNKFKSASISICKQKNHNIKKKCFPAK